MVEDAIVSKDPDRPQINTLDERPATRHSLQGERGVA
jgi:hypothetical protein